MTSISMSQKMNIKTTEQKSISENYLTDHALNLYQTIILLI
jgi:hypothetical protein